MAINLSASSLGDAELIADVREGLSDAGLARNVIFEITESAAAESLHTARALTEEFAALGCRVALDDFGTGFGSLSYLKALTITALKIDVGFVDGLLSNRSDRRVIRSIVSTARHFGIKTVAEGVEDDATLQRLRGMGVDLAQGFLFGRPAPLEPAQHLLAAA